MDYFNLISGGIIVVLSIAAIIFMVLLDRSKMELRSADAENKFLRSILGRPLYEGDLVAGEQYLRIDAPEETIFFKRVGTTVNNPMIRSVTFNSPIDAMIPEGTVFSVIQTEDGKRVLFNRRRELSPATIKTG